MKRILILGGTGDAARLARGVAQIPGLEAIISVAGRTRQCGEPAVHQRSGGFGGIAGLVDYLQERQIDGSIDATHPFAAQISFHAAAAAARLGLPHLMLVRPAWDKVEGDRWIEVESYAAAAAAFPTSAGRIFLTVGRKDLAAFAGRRDLWFLMRMVEPPLVDMPVPPGEILLDRGPFCIEGERALLQAYRIDAIASKNSGGDATYAKIVAARELEIPVVMLGRPPLPPGERVAEVESAIAWLKARL